MTQRTLARAALPLAFRQASQLAQLSLHHQPQIRSDAAQTLYGVEALMRWRHPEWGMVPPDRFIPVAEEAGLIRPMTDWLVDEACQQLLRWRQARLPVPRVALNLSAKSFHEPDFSARLAARLLVHGLQFSFMVPETTESVMMDTRSIT